MLPNFTLVDIGASTGIHKRWNILGDALNVIGFEPNQEEFEKLSQSPKKQWFNAAVAGDDGPTTLYLTKAFQNSSLLRPHFKNLKSLAWGGLEIVEEKYIQGKRLDTLAVEHGFSTDFLKIDTQGTQLDILRGAENQLTTSVIGLELEVSFYEYYENQAMFAEVDSYLRSTGFELFDLGNFCRMKPPREKLLNSGMGRLIFCDALYFRSLDLIKNSPELFDRLLLGLAAYGYFEEAAHYQAELKFPSNTIYKKIFQLQDLGTMRSILQSSFLHRFFAVLAKYFKPPTNSSWHTGLGNR